MSAQSILGVIGTATIEVAEVERLVVELENTKAALAEGMRLLELSVTVPPSHEWEQPLGADIREFLRENASC